jgi:hypothetical protein
MPRPRSAIYRRCPNCHAVRQASLFRRAGGPKFAIGGQQRRQCPACGFVGPLMGFTIVPPPKSDQGEAR